MWGYNVGISKIAFDPHRVINVSNSRALIVFECAGHPSLSLTIFLELKCTGLPFGLHREKRYINIYIQYNTISQ